MAKSNNSKTKWIWLSVLILIVSISATTIAVVSRLNNFMVDDSGALPLIPNDTPSQLNSSTSSTASQSTVPSIRPDFEASDDKTVWGNGTQVEIFRIYYKDGEQNVTVKSQDGDKLIAPGTENSYIFKFKNTGNVALDYTVEVDAYFTPNDIEIPIRSKLNRYDGKWVVGSGDEYAQVDVLDTAEDSATIGAGKYTYYTLDWLWPFESENDELDTKLGSLAADKDLVFTIEVKTTATVSSNPNDNSGITPPHTGDNTNLVLWFTLAISSFAIILFFIICKKKDKKRDGAEAETVENN